MEWKGLSYYIIYVMAGKRVADAGWEEELQQYKEILKKKSKGE